MSTFPRVRRALLYLSGWLPLLALQTLMLRQSQAGSLLQSLQYELIYATPGIICGGLCWWIATRIAWARKSRGATIGIELGLAVAFDLCWHAIFVGYLAIFAGWTVAQGLLQMSVGWQMISGLLVYGVQATAFHALRISRELRQQQLVAAAAEALRVRAEMEALRGQLNPHFLFNSLHSIIALVRDDPRRAEDALLQFAALLRRVLDVKRDITDEVSLADEMRFVDDYLAIEHLRLGERLRVTRDLTPEALACALPAFSVQPLVENAIHHAVAPRRDGGHVTLRGAVRDGRLEIQVADDGPGAEPAAVKRAPGVGLDVIRRRLRLLHGESGSLVIDTAPGRGFSATLILPAQR